MAITRGYRSRVKYGSSTSAWEEGGGPRFTGIINYRSRLLKDHSFGSILDV